MPSENPTNKPSEQTKKTEAIRRQIKRLAIERRHSWELACQRAERRLRPSASSGEASE